MPRLIHYFWSKSQDIQMYYIRSISRWNLTWISAHILGGMDGCGAVIDQYSSNFMFSLKIISFLWLFAWSPLHSLIVLLESHFEFYGIIATQCNCNATKLVYIVLDNIKYFWCRNIHQLILPLTSIYIIHVR